jgi:hypothetical protein
MQEDKASKSTVRSSGQVSKGVSSLPPRSQPDQLNRWSEMFQVGHLNIFQLREQSYRWYVVRKYQEWTRRAGNRLKILIGHATWKKRRYNNLTADVLSQCAIVVAVINPEAALQNEWRMSSMECQISIVIMIMGPPVRERIGMQEPM